MLHFPGFEKMNEALNIIGTALCVREMLFKSLRESELAGCAGCTGSCSDDARLQAKVRTDKHLHFFSFSKFFNRLHFIKNCSIFLFYSVSLLSINVHVLPSITTYVIFLSIIIILYNK